MKIIAVVLVIMAIGMAVVPMFTDCLSQGRALTTASGAVVPMKCHWSGVAEMALALPLAAVGVLLAFSKHRESRRNLGVLAIALGAAGVLIPTALIGVCASSDMLCNSVMRPSLVLMGTLVMAMGLATVVLPGLPAAAQPA